MFVWMVPRFDGSGVTDWIFKLEQYFQYYEISENRKIPIASVYMDGAALAWFQWMSDGKLFSTWRRFTELISIRFGSSQNTDAVCELVRLSQTSTVAAYQHRFEMIATKVTVLSESTLINMYISGLKAELRRELLLAKPNTVIQAMDMARLFEEKFRVAVLVSQAALPGINDLTLPSEYTAPEEVRKAGFNICPDELGSIVEGHDIKKLKVHGGVEEIAEKLSTSVTKGIDTYEDFNNILLGSNASIEVPVMVGKPLDLEEYDFGCDATKGEDVDMVTAGIISFLRVVRFALVDIASVSFSLIPTEVVEMDFPRDETEAVALGERSELGYMDFAWVFMFGNWFLLLLCLLRFMWDPGGKFCYRNRFSSYHP